MLVVASVLLCSCSSTLDGFKGVAMQLLGCSAQLLGCCSAGGPS